MTFCKICKLDKLILKNLVSFIHNELGYRLPALAALIILLILPSDGLGFSTCLFYQMFGIPCPACGLTRGMSSMLHLEWLKSVGYHPLGGIVIAYLLLCLITNEPDFLKKRLGIQNKLWLKIFSFQFLACLFVLVWIIRIV